jgi:hypothetical protein
MIQIFSSKNLINISNKLPADNPKIKKAQKIPNFTFEVIV